MELVRDAGLGAKDDVFVVPRPLLSGLPFVAAASLAFLAGLTSLVPSLDGDTLAAAFVLFAVARSSVGQHQLVSLRREADRTLRRTDGPFVPSRLTVWRASELTSDRRRWMLARAVTRLERDLSVTRLPGPVPINRVAARPHGHLLRRIAERLTDADLAVTPRGMLRVDDFLTLPSSPLYERDRAGTMGSELLACVRDLEDETA